LGAALERGSLFHAESFGFDVAFEEGLFLQFATLGGDGAFDTTVKLSPSILPSMIMSFENLIDPVISIP
jgi:hypothetical protein